MNEYDKVYDFQNLYKAHMAARLGKRDNKEVIIFELNLSQNLMEIAESLKNRTYKMSGYYSFMVNDPKERKIHALHYRDRVVQHCLCDEILKTKIRRIIDDDNLLWLLDMIIDSYEKSPGKGLPLGNQTSQWFAIYYLDGLDRLIKEQFRIKYYTRYMDDMVLIHNDKEYLKRYLQLMKKYAEKELKVEFNEKTQIFPIRNGLDYLGWHFYLTDNGKVIRKVKQQTKYKYKRKLKYMQYAYANDLMSLKEIDEILNSYHAHFDYGHTYNLLRSLLKNFILKEKDI